MDNPNNVIQQMKMQAYGAMIREQFSEATQLYSRIITIAEGIVSDQDMCVIYAERAGCHIFEKNFENALLDSEVAIDRDPSNVLGHLQKAKSLLNLHKVNDAKEAIRVGRTTAGDDELFNAFERTINKSWFTLGHKFLKLFVAMVISIIIGVATNLLGKLSGWKQGIVAMMLCMFVLFIHLRRLVQCVIFICRSCIQYVCASFIGIWNFLYRCRIHQISTISNVAPGTQNDAYQTMNIVRFKVGLYVQF